MTSKGRRPGRRPASETVFALSMPRGGRPAPSPAAWLHALDRDPTPQTDETRAIAEQLAGRAIQRGARWVVVMGDHAPKRAFKRFRRLDVAALAAQAGTVAELIGDVRAEDWVSSGLLQRAEITAVMGPDADPSPLGAIRVREAFDVLTEAGLAAVTWHDATTVTGLITCPAPRRPQP